MAKIFLFVFLSVFISATASFGMTVAEAQNQMKTAISERVSRQLSRFSDLELNVQVHLPHQSMSLLEGAASVDFQLSDYGNYVGRSSIPIGLLDSRHRVFSTVKAVVDVSVIGGYVVATHVLAKGQRIASEDVMLRRGTVNDLSRQSFGSVDMVLGKELLAAVSDGVPLTQIVVRDIPDVRRGDSVLVDYRNGGVQLRVPGEAMADGRIGDRIRIRLKLDSHKIMEGKIVDSTTVRVSSSY